MILTEAEREPVPNTGNGRIITQRIVLTADPGCLDSKLIPVEQRSDSLKETSDGLAVVFRNRLACPSCAGMGLILIGCRS